MSWLVLIVIACIIRSQFYNHTWTLNRSSGKNYVIHHKPCNVKLIDTSENASRSIETSVWQGSRKLIVSFTTFIEMLLILPSYLFGEPIVVVAVALTHYGRKREPRNRSDNVSHPTLRACTNTTSSVTKKGDPLPSQFTTGTYAVQSSPNGKRSSLERVGCWSTQKEDDDRWSMSAARFAH